MIINPETFRGIKLNTKSSTLKALTEVMLHQSWDLSFYTAETFSMIPNPSDQRAGEPQQYDFSALADLEHNSMIFRKILSRFSLKASFKSH